MNGPILGVAAGLLLFSSVGTSAQQCPAGQVHPLELIANMTRAARQFERYHPGDPGDSGPPGDPDVIYRSAAIGGKALIPVLRRIAKPGMAANTVPGAAQVSLAKLGDGQSLDQIEQELESGKAYGFPAQKLGRVGGEKVVEFLLKYFFAHDSDPSRFQTHGDYGSDSMRGVVEALASIVRNPPTIGPGGPISGDSEQWAAWWERNKTNPLAFSLSHDLQSPYLQCLGRKVEWGFPKAILDLGTAGDQNAMPALRTLTRLGDQRSRASSIDTIRGLAQAALAKLGDAEEFKAIVSELESPGSVDAVLKLQYIGGQRAAEAMLESLKGTNFLSDFPDWKYDGKNAPGIIFDHDEGIENTLVNMVVSPPDTTGEQRNKYKWLAWWAKNKDTARFVGPPVATHE
jgi:hypothetical protein